jgi:hypothetical protein
LIVLVVLLVALRALPQDLASMRHIDSNCGQLDDRSCGELLEEIANLSDPSILAEIAMSFHFADARLAAVNRLSDQSVLRTVASEANQSDAALRALEKMTDLTLIAELAAKSSRPDTKVAAALRLENRESILQYLALHDENLGVRIKAVAHISDEGVLAKVAIHDEDSDVQEDALKRIVSQSALAEVAANAPWWTAALAVSRMDSTDVKGLRQIAGDLRSTDQSPSGAAARVILATVDPTVLKRFPAIKVEADFPWASQDYQDGVMKATLRRMDTHIVLTAEGGTLAEESWSDTFSSRETFPTGPVRGFRTYADVDCAALLAKLFASGRFSQEDLLHLSASEIPEVRVAAVKNLLDEKALENIFAKDKCPEVWEAAGVRLQRIHEDRK